MIATAEKPARAKGRQQTSPPPLENGDRLSDQEFLRRYEAMPHIRKAELIEGVVFMSSPVRMEEHAVPDNLIQGWLFNYVAATPGVVAFGNATVKMDAGNIPQPDAGLRILESAGGRSQVVEGYLEGGPELVVEIAASSASKDLHDKKKAYLRNGVQEYLVLRTLDAHLDWFAVREGAFHKLQPDANGLCRSEVFPGLVLDVNALLRGDAAVMLAALQRGLADPAHSEFVARLKSKQNRSRRGRRS